VSKKLRYQIGRWLEMVISQKQQLNNNRSAEKNNLKKGRGSKIAVA